MGMRKERELLSISVCLRSARRTSTKRGAIECKVLVFLPTFPNPPPPPPAPHYRHPDPERQDQQKLESDQKVTYQNVSQIKRASAAKDVIASAAFFLLTPEESSENSKDRKRCLEFGCGDFSCSDGSRGPITAPRTGPRTDQSTGTRAPDRCAMTAGPRGAAPRTGASSHGRSKAKTCGEAPFPFTGSCRGGAAKVRKQSSS